MNKLLSVLLAGLFAAGAFAGTSASGTSSIDPRNTGDLSASAGTSAGSGGSAGVKCSARLAKKNGCTAAAQTSKMGNRGTGRSGPGPDEIATGGKPLSPKSTHGSAHDD